MPLNVAKLPDESNCLAVVTRFPDSFTDIPHDFESECGVLIIEQNPLYFFIRL